MTRQGSITCAKCGSWTRTTKNLYGGLRRVVCINDACPESEEQAFASSRFSLDDADNNAIVVIKNVTMEPTESKADSEKEGQ